MILIPKRDLILPIRSHARLRGRFLLEAVNAGDGRRRMLANWFPNLITNNGLDLLGSSPNGWQYTCAVGSGNTPPAVTDTALVTLVASTTSIQSQSATAQSASPYFGTRTSQFNFAAGTATGNLSEIGVGATATSLFSRALILDSSGNPTTITVLSNEALYATYQVEQIVPTADVTGTVTIAGVAYDFVARAANATTTGFWAPNTLSGAGASSAYVSNGTIGAITGTISGTVDSNNTVTAGGYTLGSYTQQSTISFGLTDGNVPGGISAMQVTFGGPFEGRGCFQYSFSPAIPKDASHVLTLTVSTSWARG